MRVRTEQGNLSQVLYSRFNKDVQLKAEERDRPAVNVTTARFHLYTHANAGLCWLTGLGCQSLIGVCVHVCFYWSCYRELHFSPKDTAGVTLRWRGEGRGSKVPSAVLRAAVTVSAVL